MTAQKKRSAVNVNRWLGTTLQILCVAGMFHSFHPSGAFPAFIILPAVTFGMIVLLFGTVVLGVSDGKPLYRRVWGLIAFVNAHLNAYLLNEMFFGQSAQAGAALSYALISTVVSVGMCVMEAFGTS